MLSMRNIFGLFFGCLVSLFIASCGKTERASQTHMRHTKHFDIPLPLSFKQTSEFAQQQDGESRDLIQYQGALSVQQTITFYTREMERVGWDIADLSTLHEGFLYCNKPTKHCGISIRASSSHHKEKATTLSLFVSNK